MKKTILILMLFVGAFSLHVNAQEILATHGWESGTTFGPMGSLWNSAATITEVTGDSDEAHTGEGYLHIVIDDTPANPWDNQSVFQGFEIEEDASYRIGLWMKGTTGDEDAVNVTAGNNDYAQLNGGPVVLTEDYKFYSCMVYISSDTDLGTTDPSTIRFPIHYYGVGEIFVDDVTVAQSTIGGITYNEEKMAVNFGYPIDYTASVSADAFTITVDGTTVKAIHAEMMDDADNVEPVVYLVLDTPIAEGSEVTVDYDGTADLYYTDYNPDASAALDFSEEIAVYDAMLDFQVTVSAENINDIQCRVSPNPVVDQLNIRSVNTIQSYEILDLSGKKIMGLENQNKSNLNVNVSALKAGVYMVKVNDVKGNVSLAKFIK